MVRRRYTSFTLFFACATVIFLIEYFIIQTFKITNLNSFLVYAVTIDISLGIPLLYYLLIVRKKYLPPTTTIIVFLLSIFVLKLILPERQQDHLKYVVLIVAPTAELIVIIWSLRKTARILSEVRSANRSSLYFSDALRLGIKSVVGPSIIADIVASELSVIFYALTGWFRRRKTDNGNLNFFTYHRANNYTTIVFVLLFMMVVETLVLHQILSRWSPLLAWIVTGLSVYGTIWFLGDFHAIRLQPILVTDKTVFIRCGLRWRVEFPLSIIEKIEQNSQSNPGPNIVRISTFGEPDVFIWLKQRVFIYGLFGLKKSSDTIGINVDNPKMFIQLIRNRVKTFTDVE